MLGSGLQGTYFGVVIAVGKAHGDGSTSVVYGRDLIDDGDGAGLCGNGNPFQLKNEKEFYIWFNNDVRSHQMKIGTVFKYVKLTSGDYRYHDEVDVKLNQNIDKILMDMDYGWGCYKGINDAFPDATQDNKGHLFKQDSPPQPRIALIGIKKGQLKDERILFTTQKGEVVNLKLYCRYHGNITEKVTHLPIKCSDEETIECAVVVAFAKNPVLSRGVPTCYAVCEGIISKKKAQVLSIDYEEVKLLNSHKELVDVVKNGFKILLDTGNNAQTAVSEKLVEFLNLKIDRTKMFCVEGVGGQRLGFPSVTLKLLIRQETFPIISLVGALASGTDLLIGRDIIDPLLEKGFTIGS